MPFMRVVEVTRDDVIRVTGVGHGFVTANVSVLMCCIMSVAFMTSRARGGITAGCSEFVLVGVSVVRVVKMSVVEIVGVIVVFYRRVTAAASMIVSVRLVRRMGRHV